MWFNGQAAVGGLKLKLFAHLHIIFCIFALCKIWILQTFATANLERGLLRAMCALQKYRENASWCLSTLMKSLLRIVHNILLNFVNTLSLMVLIFSPCSACYICRMFIIPPYVV